MSLKKSNRTSYLVCTLVALARNHIPFSACLATVIYSPILLLSTFVFSQVFGIICQTLTCGRSSVGEEKTLFATQGSKYLFHNLWWKGEIKKIKNEKNEKNEKKLKRNWKENEKKEKEKNKIKLS